MKRVEMTKIFQLLANSSDELQDLDITLSKKLDRKKRDLSTQPDSNDDDDDEKTESEAEKEIKSIEKRSNVDEEKVVSSFDDVSELLDGSKNADDVHRRTRQLRPSIISSPWRVSSGASYRAIDFAPHNGFGSNLQNFPSATSGLLYKSDGRFYPTNNFKSSPPSTSSDEFNPVISTYSGGNKNKYFNSYSGESGERSQEPTPKYKQSSKIPGHSSSLYPLLFSLDSFDSKAKVTTARPVDSQDNYSYFHFGKAGSQNQQQQHQLQKPDKQKTYAFPVTNLPSTTHRNPFAGYNSVGGFFNNNNNQFLPLKPVSKHATPAPIYEGAKSASSYDSRYTTASPIKATPSTPYASNPFLNNLAFNHQSPTIFNFGNVQDKKKDAEKVVQITTKKPTFTQYPIPSSTPKYLQAYTTPNQLFDFDKFVAGIREAQRLQQNGQQIFSSNSLSPKNKTHGAEINQNYRYQHVYTTSTTASPDEYYYEEDDDEDESPIGVDDNLTKFKTQSAKPSISAFNRRPVSNLATNNDDEDFYYDDEDEDDDEEFVPIPPPIHKSKYMPMTETMAPRPMNFTTIRPYYVSGHTFSTPAPPPSTTSLFIPSIIKFPDDVFQAIRPFTSPAPNLIQSHKIKPNKNYDITKSTTTSTTTERTSTKRTKIKILTKATTAPKKSNDIQHTTSSTTAKPTRLTTRRKIYTIKPNRGNLKFKVSTKRPDLTRLEIDEKLPNR